MSQVERKFKSSKVCNLCGKGDIVSFNRPKSLHKTKRTVKPNLQTKWGYTFCQRCFRTLKKKGVKIMPDLC